MSFHPLNCCQPLPIITLDNSRAVILKEKTLDIQPHEFSTAEEIVNQLFSSLQPLMPAAGLAAPQIGINRSIFIYTYDRKPENLEAAINPSYTPVGEETIEGYDACFSSPLRIAKLKRYKTIHATYLNVKGEKVEKTLDGFGAKVFQHEYDHLQGIVNINRPDAEV